MGKSRFRKGEKWGKNKYANEMKKEKASEDAYNQERKELEAKVVELEREYYQRYTKDDLISLAIGNYDYEGCCVGYWRNEEIRELVTRLEKDIPLVELPSVNEWLYASTTKTSKDDFTEDEWNFLVKYEGY